MKKLEHGKASRCADGPSQNAISRRKFFTLGVAGMFAAKLALGGFGASFFLPTTANAQVLRIGGLKVFTLRLSDTVNKLDKQTSKYRRGQHTSTSGAYATVIEISGEDLKASVVLNPPSGRSRLGVTFPPEKDRKPQGQIPGHWGMIIEDFIRVVEEKTGQNVAGIKWIVDKGANGGNCINIYALPVNPEGEIIGKHEGGYLVAGASYYPQKGAVYGAIGLLLEPGTPEPVASQ